MKGRKTLKYVFRYIKELLAELDWEKHNNQAMFHQGTKSIFLISNKHVNKENNQYSNEIKLAKEKQYILTSST